MYLKEIVTNGFKSFAEKMTISLDGKTTCIVGPNGSGKSNIVDAVRWVLGEQSVKSLRGEGSMSDVIFAGSDSRKPKTAASVELIFDNSDKYLNIEYTEVSVKRRVFRSGENEYFLNNDRCRLKDIISLFLDSGIGRASFNIIGQGEVQQILSDSKDDRRMIFEEAAGILKYKKRKEEALRKLDRTHQAMERIEDIILELERQLKPLEEQSKKAQEYLTTKERLEALEISLLAYDIYQYSHEEELLQTTKKTISKEITELLGNTNIVSSDELKEKNTLLTLEKELAFSQRELLTTTEEVATLEGQRNVLKAQRQEQDDNTKVEQLRKLHTERASLTKEVALLEQDIEILNQEWITKKETNQIKDNELHRQKLDKKQLEQEYSRLDREILSHKHKIDLLKGEEERGSHLPYAIQQILKEQSLQGIYNILGKVVTTKDDYARALDVALMSSKNFVIVKDEQSAQEAIRYLKNQKLGRATFFPLTVIKSRSLAMDVQKKLQNLPGYVGILADLVKYDDIYRSIIYNQLGLVIVAEDMDSALAISRHIDRRYKIITLAGDVINVGGSMTGGALLKGNSSILLRQEIEACTTTINSLQIEQKMVINDLEELATKAMELEDKNFTLMKEIGLLEQQLLGKKEELATKKKIITTLHETIANLEGSEDLLDQKEQQLIELFYQKSTYKEKLEHKISSLHMEIQKTKEVIESIEADHKYKNNLLRKKEEQQKELEIKLSRLDIQLNTLLDTLTSDYSITYDKARQDYPLEMEIEEARKKVENDKANIKRLGMVNLAAIEEYERISTRYEFLLHQKEDLTKAETTLLEIMDEMDEVMKEEFLKTFEEIRAEFQKVFIELFHGGHADLKLTAPLELLTTGIEIVASPPGKKLSTINLLSGGEKTLTAISLLFAILNVRTVPFCIFDEVEAALDEANVDQFGQYLNHYKNKTQFLIITHKKKTMEYADTLYGITMQESGVSKLVSVKLTNKLEVLGEI